MWRWEGLNGVRRGLLGLIGVGVWLKGGGA